MKKCIPNKISLFLAIDGTNNYLNGQLWKLCAGPLFVHPEIGDKLVTSINDDLCQLKPIFDIPSKICCNVFSINLQVETNTDEIYAEVSLLPDNSEVEIPFPETENNIQNINYFTKVLSASDTHKTGGFVFLKRHAIECLPLLDMSQPTPSQEIIAKDIHGTPKRHLFTSGWNEFAKEKKLVAGDSFVFLRREWRITSWNQKCNIPSSVISKQSMHHGVVATALDAIKRKCMFVVKPIFVNFNKFIDGVNKKFTIGSRFSMKFEGNDFNEIRCYGTIVGVRDFSTHWKDSEWRSLEVQWDGDATIPRPDKVSPWEIDPLTHSSNILKSDFLKHKRQSTEVHEFGSSMWAPTLTQGQEVGQSSIQSSMRYSFPTMSKPNYNEQMSQAMKETSTTTATTSYRLFGVDLMVPFKTKSPIKHRFKVKNYVAYKVHMEGAIEIYMDLTIFDGYNKLIDELERLFDIKGELHMHNQHRIFFIDNDGDMMTLGNDPWPKFCNMAKEIFISSKKDAKTAIADNKLSEGDPTLIATILPAEINNS
ncbi:hypothetical protein N665_0202s0021 [Sinapis alba]|nr:hypothetical protein N665_0202s0021 [Sinapis alba]